tara:strand:+ start:306 stop:473 length:168 start_codon:yes stop_codon:yes gene_type:complete
MYDLFSQNDCVLVFTHTSNFTSIITFTKESNGKFVEACVIFKLQPEQVIKKKMSM